MFFARLCRAVRTPIIIPKRNLLHSSAVIKAQTKLSVPGTYRFPDPDERLKNLKSGERTVAIFAIISLSIGFIALKTTFSKMSSKTSENKELKQLPVLVIAGPSGSGKSTLLKKLFQQYPDTYAFSVSHTTRKPRHGEVDKKDYHFTTQEKMRKAIDDGEFIEWAEYSGNLYGTSVQSVKDCQKQGKICVLDIDMQGVRSIKKTGLNAFYVHIKPPSLEELEKRLRARKTDTDEAVQKRLEVAKTELEYAAHPGNFDHTIVNDDVEIAYKSLDTILKKKIGEMP